MVALDQDPVSISSDPSPLAVCGTPGPSASESSPNYVSAAPRDRAARTIAPRGALRLRSGRRRRRESPAPETALPSTRWPAGCGPAPARGSPRTQDLLAVAEWHHQHAELAGSDQPRGPANCGLTSTAAMAPSTLSRPRKRSPDCGHSMTIWSSTKVSTAARGHRVRGGEEALDQLAVCVILLVFPRADRRRIRGVMSSSFVATPSFPCLERVRHRRRAARRALRSVGVPDR